MVTVKILVEEYVSMIGSDNKMGQSNSGIIKFYFNFKFVALQFS
jgi:hypothetical protein